MLSTLFNYKLPMVQFKNHFTINEADQVHQIGHRINNQLQRHCLNNAVIFQNKRRFADCFN